LPQRVPKQRLRRVTEDKRVDLYASHLRHRVGVLHVEREVAPEHNAAGTTSPARYWSADVECVTESIQKRRR
jgi:hypothetical protein